MRKRKYNLPAHVCWDVTSDNYHVSITVDGKRYSNKYNTVKDAMERVVDILYKKAGKWTVTEANKYMAEYPKYKYIDDNGGKYIENTTHSVNSTSSSEETLVAILGIVNSPKFMMWYKEVKFETPLNVFAVHVSDNKIMISGYIFGDTLEVGIYEHKKESDDNFVKVNAIRCTKEEFCSLLQKIEPYNLNWCDIEEIDRLVHPNKYQVVSTSKYTGHDTTKYNTICVKDRFILEGKKHSLLVNSLHKAQYILREDGEVFSYNPETGDMKHKVQYCSESGGVKNRARREAGKGGGSVYQTVGLWNYQFLTHKLVAKYIAEDTNTTGKKERVSSRFYKGIMPNGFGKRCYKAN